jgi:hypothetical protein
VNTVMNLRIAYNFGNFLCSCTTGDLWSRAQLREVSYWLGFRDFGVSVRTSQFSSVLRIFTCWSEERVANYRVSTNRNNSSEKTQGNTKKDEEKLIS